MGVLDKLNGNPKLGFGVGAAVVLVGLGIVILQVSSGGAVQTPRYGFYTDDDGKTFFKDDIKKIPPFDHGGKKALRADVFKEEGGKEFVGLVYRFTDAGRKEMETYLAKKLKDPEGALREGIERRRMQVKKAGADDKTWAAADEETVSRLRAGVKGPSGKPVTLFQP